MNRTATTREDAPTRRDWMGLAVMSIGLGLIVLDGTIVGVALPTIIGDLQLDITDAQWVGGLYAVLLAALLLVTGNLADRVGRKRTLLAGLGVFVAGSLLAAMAGDAGPLIGARAVQAVGSALIMPSTLSTVNAVFRGRHRAAAFGVWGAVISGAAALGPLAGGALTQWLSWHWIFLVNLPLGAVVFVAALITVRETRDEGARRGVDALGAVLSAVGFGALVFGVIEGPDLGWWRPAREFAVLGMVWPADAAVSVVPVALGVGALALVAFLTWERHRARVGRAALLDLSLFGLRTFSWGNLTAGAMARHVAARWGAPGTVVMGLSLELCGVVGLALVTSAGTSPVLVALLLAVYGVGLGLASAQLTGMVLQDVPVALSGQASATQSTVRQVGSALGTALSGAVLSMVLLSTRPRFADGAVDPATARELVELTQRSAGGFIDGLREGRVSGDLGSVALQIVGPLEEWFAAATRGSLALAAAFLAPGLVGALRLRRATDVARP